MILASSDTIIGVLTRSGGSGNVGDGGSGSIGTTESICPLSRKSKMASLCSPSKSIVDWFGLESLHVCNKGCVHSSCNILQGRRGFAIRLSVNALLLVSTNFLHDRMAVARRRSDGTTLPGDDHDGGSVVRRCTRFFGELSVVAFV